MRADPTLRQGLASLLLVTAPAATGACADSTTSSPAPAPTTQIGEAAPREQRTSPDARVPKAKAMQIEITVRGERLEGTLLESAAARDLVAQLPTTLRMVDHGAVEKTGPLVSPLSLEGHPAGAAPDAGDIGYYAPGNDLVFYYGDQSYYEGIVVLGQLEAGAAQRLAVMEGAITATIAPARG